MEKKNPNTRSCASFMLEILLDALPDALGNQPTKIGLIFKRYYLWSNQYGPVDTIATAWKKGTRKFDRFLTEFYEQRPEELQCDFRDNVLPAVRDCNLLAKQFCSLIERSNVSREIKEQRIPASLDQFSPEKCSDFLADTMCFFMSHQDYVLRIGAAAPPPAYILGCRVPAPCEHFCGRDKEIEALHELLLGKGFAFVTGLAGMGKSELSRAYAHVHSQDYASYYQHTIYVTFYNSLRETICTIPFEGDEKIRQRYAKRRDLLLEALSKAPEPNSKWQEELENLDQACSEELFQDHDEKFQQMDPDTLLIIDNLDIPSEQEPLLERVMQYPCNVLFTTRYRYPEYPSLELTEIQDSKAWVSLVASYFSKAKKFSKEIQEMVSLLHGHTLFVELSARLLGMGALTVPELLDQLRSREWGIDDPVKLRKDGMVHSKTFLEFLRMIFPLFQMAPEEQYILTNLALFPRQGIGLTDFKKWLGLTTAGDVSAEERSMNKQRIAAIYTLADKGLIQNREGILFLHDLIREVIGAEEEVAPSIQRCKTLIWNLCILCVPEKPEALEEPLPEGLFPTAENVVKWARKDDEELYWKFLSAVFSAMVLHGYQSGVRLLAGELRQRLGPTGTPLDIVRKSFDHYLHAATADTQEEAEQEHQAALENLGNLPIEEALQSSDKKELNWLLGQQMGGLTCLLEKTVGKKGMTDLEKKFQQECAYFQTEEGQAELSGQISEFLKIATPAAQDIQAGKRSKVTIRDLLSPFLGKKK